MNAVPCVYYEVVTHILVEVLFKVFTVFVRTVFYPAKQWLVLFHYALDKPSCPLIAGEIFEISVDTTHCCCRLFSFIYRKLASFCANIVNFFNIFNIFVEIITIFALYDELKRMQGHRRRSREPPELLLKQFFFSHSFHNYLFIFFVSQRVRTGPSIFLSVCIFF